MLCQIPWWQTNNENGGRQMEIVLSYLIDELEEVEVTDEEDYFCLALEAETGTRVELRTNLPGLLAIEERLTDFTTKALRNIAKRGDRYGNNT